MKIVVLTTCHKPNDDRIYYKQILSLLSKYPKVFFVAPVRADESYKLSGGVELHAMPFRKGLLGRLVTVFTAAIKVVRLNPDVCHFHDLDFVIMVPVVRLLRRTKMVYDAHEVYPESMLISPHIPVQFRAFTARSVDLVEKACARFCSLIVTADTPNSESFLRTGIPTVTLFNYPPRALFETKILKNKDLSKAFAGRRVLIYQGTMSRDRGLFHMLDGMRLLKDAVPEALLLLVGLSDDGLRAQVEEQIQRDQLQDYVHIVPWLPHTEIASYVSIAEIGLAPLQPNPKFNKNIPIKIFEYMACGIPLLAANLPAITHFITDSGAGVVYDSTDAKVFASEVQRMLGDHALLASMSKKGRECVAQWWNWGEMEKLLLGAYAGLESI